MSTKKFWHMVMSIYSTLPKAENGGQLINTKSGGHMKLTL